MRENINLNNEKGSITVFVLVALLFMSAFLMISYASNVNKSKVAKEQFNIIQGIYKGNENIIDSYQEVYTELRNKNKQIITTTKEENTSTIELYKTFEDKIINYKIYGSSEGVGVQVTDETDENVNKYIIQVKITDDNENNTNSKTYKIVLNNPLLDEEYIDYSKQKVFIKDENGEYTSYSIELPELHTFEDYTKIEILTESSPEKITIDYMGYTLE